VLLMVIITEKNKKIRLKKNEGPSFKRMKAHHSKDHRIIDFEPLVTEEEVRLVKARKFH